LTIAVVGMTLWLAACAGGQSAAPASTPKPAALGAIPTANPDMPACQRSLWDDFKVQDKAVQSCHVNGPRQPEGQRQCVEFRVERRPSEVRRLVEIEGRKLHGPTGRIGRTSFELICRRSISSRALRLEFLIWTASLRAQDCYQDLD